MKIIILSFVLFGMTYVTFAQNSGYYRSKNSGRWDEASTWETSPDSVNWTNASFSPDFHSNTIVLESGDTVSVLKTVTVDQTIIKENAFLIVNGPGSDTSVTLHVANSAADIDMSVFGTIKAMGVDTTSPFSVNVLGVLAFEPGSVYEHAQNGGGIPFSLWKPGSTLKLTGTADKRPSNRAQDYSNIIVDLPSLMVNLNMGFNENIISGDIRILNTNTYRWVLVGPTSNETRTVTIMGDIFLENGNFNTHGTENGNSIAIVHTYGNIYVTSGNFSIARASQSFTGTTTWYLHGDLSISNAVTQNANPIGAKFVYTGPGEHKLTLNNVTFGPGGLPIEVDNTILDIGTSIIKDSSKFNLKPGSTLIVAHQGGLDSFLQNTGETILSSEANYVFNGTAEQITGQKLPAQVNKLSVNNSSGITLSHDVTVNDTVDITAGNMFLGGTTLTLGNEAVLAETGGLVTGSPGKIVTHRNLNAPDNLNPGNIGAEITTTANLGMTTIERFHYPANLNGTNSISRQYYINPENNTSLNASLRLYYDESELDTISEDHLGIFTSNDGITWEPLNSTVNQEQNYAEAAGLNTFSYFTLGYSDKPVGVGNEISTAPTEYYLFQNYPNPFNPETIIKYDLPDESFVNLSVYNAIGEKVLTVIDQVMDGGRHTQKINSSNLPSGTYIYRLSAGGNVYTRKMMIIK